MTAKIPRSVLDTKSLSRAKALSAWEENIGVMYGIRLVDKASDDFFAKVDAYQFETLMLGECQTVAQSYERSRFRISRDLIDCYAIQLQEKGAWTRRDNGDEASGGDILVLDKAQPQSIAMTDSTTLHLFVPRAVLAPLLSEPDAHNMQVLRASTPLASLLRGHVHNLWRNAAHLDIDEAAGVVQPTVQLIAAAMNGRVAPETLNGIDTALGGAVRRYVNRAALDPDLSVDVVAKAFGISKRKTYYLFQAYDGFEAYVRRQRLRLVHAALRSSAYAGTSITDLAEAHGFTQRKNFNDAFRKAYGMTPSQVRELARQGASDSPDSPGSARWRDWIAGM